MSCLGGEACSGTAERLDLIGPVTEEFRLAIDALLEDARRESGAQVRDALLSMGGARLVVQRLIVPTL